MGWRELADVKVGDKLTYNPGHRYPYEFRTVARVMKNGIVDDRGDRWTISGNVWGEGRDSWSRTSIRKYRSQDEETNKELRKEAHEKAKINKIESIGWRNLPIETVDAVLELLGETVKEPFSE